MIKTIIFIVLLILGMGSFDKIYCQEKRQDSADIKMEEIEIKGKAPRPEAVYIIQKALFKPKRVQEKISLIPYILDSVEESCL